MVSSRFDRDYFLWMSSVLAFLAAERRRNAHAALVRDYWTCRSDEAEVRVFSAPGTRPWPVAGSGRAVQSRVNDRIASLPVGGRFAKILVLSDGYFEALHVFYVLIET